MSTVFSESRPLVGNTAQTPLYQSMQDYAHKPEVRKTSLCTIRLHIAMRKSSARPLPIATLRHESVHLIATIEAHSMRCYLPVLNLTKIS